MPVKVCQQSRMVVKVSKVRANICFFMAMASVGGLKCCSHGEVFDMVGFESNNEL